jgi:hypothetical protein
MRRLRYLVYLDAAEPLPGESWSSLHDEATRSARRQAVAQHGTLAPPDPAAYGLSGSDGAWVARRQTPHPGGVYDIPLEFDAGKIGGLPRTFISCTSPASRPSTPRGPTRAAIPAGHSSKCRLATIR